MKILLGVTGSVAAKLTPKMQQVLTAKGHEVKTVFTKSALYFHNTKSALKFHNGKSFDEYADDDEWSCYSNENRVLHIDLTKWADRFVVAPCTANTMAKIVHGFCDNLVTSCVRAWDLSKRLDVAPAMNCKMWDNPVTQSHRESLVNRGYFIHDPIEKELFCGDVGMGAMASIEDIFRDY